MTDFDEVVKQYHLALSELGRGNPDPVKKMFSHREDVSAAGGFGGVMHGWKQVAENTELAASRFKGGGVPNFENIVKYSTPDLGYIVEIEKYKAEIVGSEDAVPVTLRVTSIFRKERRPMETCSSTWGSNYFDSTSPIDYSEINLLNSKDHKYLRSAITGIRL